MFLSAILLRLRAMHTPSVYLVWFACCAANRQDKKREQSEGRLQVAVIFTFSSSLFQDPPVKFRSIYKTTPHVCICNVPSLSSIHPQLSLLSFSVFVFVFATMCWQVATIHEVKGIKRPQGKDMICTYFLGDNNM